MVAYAIFMQEKLRDVAQYKDYQAKVRSAGAGHSLKPLAIYGALESLEGAPVEGAVILEFPDMAAAKAYYHSAAYQDAARHRHLAADYRVFIIEGL